MKTWFQLTLQEKMQRTAKMIAFFTAVSVMCLLSVANGFRRAERLKQVCTESTAGQVYTHQTYYRRLHRYDRDFRASYRLNQETYYTEGTSYRYVYQKGDNVQVYYNPDKPSESYADTPQTANVRFLVLTLTLCFGTVVSVGQLCALKKMNTNTENTN